MQPSYSVIIPHRDINELLDRCLRSIPQRDDIEVIIVDDGSSSVPQSSRREVRVVSLTESRGAGNARNIGVQQAHGTWILFIDADDFFLPGAFDTLDRYADGDSDVCLFYPERCYSDTMEPANVLFPKNHFIEYYLGHYGKRMLLLRQMVPHGKMIRRQFLLDNPDITFPCCLAAEDLLWNSKMAVNVSSIEVIDAALYVFTIRRDSQTYDIPHAKMMDVYQQFLDTHDYLLAHHVPYRTFPNIKGMKLAERIGGDAPKEMLDHIRAIGRYDEYLEEQRVSKDND